MRNACHFETVKNFRNNLPNILANFLQYFDLFQVIFFVEVLKVNFCLSDDFIVKAKSISPELILQVCRDKIVTGIKSGEYGG